MTIREWICGLSWILGNGAVVAGIWLGLGIPSAMVVCGCLFLINAAIIAGEVE